MPAAMVTLIPFYTILQIPLTIHVSIPSHCQGGSEAHPLTEEFVMS